MSGDKQIIGADGLAGSLKPGADQAMGFIGGRLAPAYDNISASSDR
jgi:hypothetical protein